MSKCRMRNWMIWDGLDRLLCEPHMLCVCTAPRKIIQEWEISTFFFAAHWASMNSCKRERNTPELHLIDPKSRKSWLQYFMYFSFFILQRWRDTNNANSHDVGKSFAIEKKISKISPQPAADCCWSCRSFNFFMLSICVWCGGMLCWLGETFGLSSAKKKSNIPIKTSKKN